MGQIKWLVLASFAFPTPTTYTTPPAPIQPRQHTDTKVKTNVLPNVKLT